MKRSIYASSVLTLLVAVGCGGGEDAAAGPGSATKAKPGGATKADKGGKVPWNADMVPSPAEDFVVEEDVLSPEDAQAAAEAEITAENADEEFEKLKKAIQDG